MRVLCSTGVFTRTSDPRSHEAILHYGSQFAVDGYEVIVYPGWYAALDEVSQALRASGLAFPVVHVEKGVGEKFGSGEVSVRAQGVADFERNCDFAQRLGANLVVLHLWGLPESDTHLERNLRLLPRCLDIAAHYGLALAIETIPGIAADPLANIAQVIACDARACVALDTEFLAMHDQLDYVFAAAWVWEGSLVQHVHLKDFAANAGDATARRYLYPGDGQIDFGSFVRRLRSVGFDGALSLEARGIDGEGRVEVDCIAASLRLIADLARER